MRKGNNEIVKLKKKRKKAVPLSIDSALTITVKKAATFITILSHLIYNLHVVCSKRAQLPIPTLEAKVGIYSTQHKPAGLLSPHV